MPFITNVDTVVLGPQELEESKKPRLTYSQDNQAAFEICDLKFDAQREVLFQDNGQIRSFDNNHRLVFNRQNNRLELHEEGDISFLTGGPTPTEKLKIQADGKVGIGTDGPQGKLHIVGGTDAELGGGGYLILGQTNAGNMAIDDNEILARNNGQKSTLHLQASGGDLVVHQKQTDATKFVIKDDGNVGIGTSSPNHRLRIAGGPTWTSNGWGGSLELENATAIGWRANSANQRFGFGHTNGGFYIFRTASDPGTAESPANYDLVINDSGNVGIGTTDPKAKLEVAGFLKTSSLSIGGGTVVTKLVAGSISVGSSGSQLKVVTVTFPEAFSTAPQVIAVARASGDFPDVFAVTIRSVAKDKFVANVLRLDSPTGWGQNLQLDWFAWDVPSRIVGRPDVLRPEVVLRP
jgi:hypothetical protein